MSSKKDPIKWNELWLEKIDQQGQKCGTWAIKEDSDYVRCKLCACKFKYSGSGGIKLIEHSRVDKHRENFELSRTNHVIASQPSTSTDSSSISSSSNDQQAATLPPPLPLKLDNPVNAKARSAEAKWLFKVAESDYSLRSCDHTPELFSSMFKPLVHKKCDCRAIFDHFSLSRTKASYCISDRLGPLVMEKLKEQLQWIDSCFTLLFDETSTVQRKKQMDVLVRFWSDQSGHIETRYIDSFFFGRAPGEKIVELLHELMLPTEQDIWCKMFNLSSDSPYINQKVHRLLNQELRKSGHYGLLPFIGCTLHIMHNAFHIGIKVMSVNIEDLVYDLHAWFKISPCKEEDFRNLNEEISIDESLFLKHVSTRWLTLSPALQRIQERWDSTTLNVNATL